MSRCVYLPACDHLRPHLEASEGILWPAELLGIRVLSDCGPRTRRPEEPPARTEDSLVAPVPVETVPELPPYEDNNDLHNVITSPVVTDDPGELEIESHPLLLSVDPWSTETSDVPELIPGPSELVEPPEIVAEASPVEALAVEALSGEEPDPTAPITMADLRIPSPPGIAAEAISTPAFALAWESLPVTATPPQTLPAAETPDPALAGIGTADDACRLVAEVYRSYLGQEPQVEFMYAALTRLAENGTLAQLKAQILGSEDYLLLRGGGTESGFVRALYRDVAQRAVDHEALSYHLQTLNSGGSREEVALSVLRSSGADGVFGSQTFTPPTTPFSEETLEDCAHAAAQGVGSFAELHRGAADLVFTTR